MYYTEDTAMKLYIIRHGETDWNKQRRLQGQSDTELNEYGIRLAQITGEALKDIRFDHIFSSPLKRAYRTAEIIRDGRTVPIVTDDRLKEIGFGINEGVSSELITADFHYFLMHLKNTSRQKAERLMSSYVHARGTLSTM